MNTRRFSRTLDEAFGPYNRSSQCRIVPMADEPMPRVDVWVLCACAIAGIAVVILLAAEQVPL